MTNSTIADNIILVADRLRSIGFKSHIDRRLPWLSIQEYGGTVFFMQGSEASNLISEIDDLAGEFDVPTQDSFLYLIDTTGLLY